MTDHEFREGPPRYFMPISTCGPNGFTFHGPMGYEEIDAEEAARRIGLGRIVVEAEEARKEK